MQYKEVKEFILKIIIASIAWMIIIFYNAEPIGYQIQWEEIYDKAIENYKHHNSQSSEIMIIDNSNITWWSLQISGNNNSQLENSIKIDSKWTIEEQQIIKNTVINIINTLDTYLQTDKKLKETLQSITINKEKWKSRWYATHDSVTINYGDMSDQEFIQVVTHELWHIIDLWIIQWRSLIKSNTFTEFNEVVFAEDDSSLWYYTLSRESERKRKKSANKQGFCSIYGMSNPFEDLSECLQLYFNHHDYFMSIKNSSQTLERKYEFIKNLFGWKYRYANFVEIKENNITYRHRDTTKM